MSYCGCFVKFHSSLFPSSPYSGLTGLIHVLRRHYFIFLLTAIFQKSKMHCCCIVSRIHMYIHLLTLYK